jgi:hypothetical protein
MKRIFVSLSLMLAVGLTTALANDEINVGDKVKESFKKEFAGAEPVKWSDLGDYQKATFVFGGHRVEAYFNADGVLEGTARDLFFDQLPLAVMRSFDKRFAGADIIDVVEVTNTEGTSYRLTLETQHKRYRVKADTGGNILEVVKVNK